MYLVGACLCFQCFALLQYLLPHRSFLLHPQLVQRLPDAAFCQILLSEQAHNHLVVQSIA
jgi:hypothetical protein